MHGSEEEFYFVFIGGIVLAILLVLITLVAFGLLVLKKNKEKKLNVKLYEQKQRKNGKPGTGIV